MQFDMFIGVIFLELTFQSLVRETLWMYFLLLLGDIISQHHTVSDSLAFTIFLPLLLQCSLSLRCESLWQMHPLELSSITLHLIYYGFLYGSPIVAKRSFLGDE